MDLKATASHAEKFLRDNSPAILTGFGVTGVISTAYLAHQVGFTTGYRGAILDDRGDRPLTRREWVRDHWKRYIPAVVSGGATITCIVLATRISNRRTAVITAAYSVSERAFSEYKEKVKEKLGERKEQGIRDDIAADKVRNNPPGEKVIVLAGEGNVLCYELHTGRPFVSSMEALKKAENELNAKVLREDYAYMHNFYDFAGIPHTDSDYDFGWTSDRLMELEFTSVLHKDKPVLAFAYNYYKPL